jgi:cyclase|tara:strand:+ start:272 stop:1129 length:858 start_codon:yes stop_codon:yes gene_type:complete
MSLALRVIPRLDIKGPNLVKGMHLEGLRVLGKPEHFARYYYEQGADEMFYQDVVASLYGRNSLHEIISRTAKEMFIPLTVGGGLRTLEDILAVLRAGADKVSINTAAHENPELITQASRMFGKSTIAVAIEAIRQPDGTYKAFTDNGRNRTGREAVSWAKEVEELGAGEILLTSVDREGTGMGPDMDLIWQVHANTNIPLVVHGGIGSSKHALSVIKNLPVSGIALASMLHYHYLKTNRNVDGFEDEGNIEFLKSNRIYSRVDPMSLAKLKENLFTNNVVCRLTL